MREWGQVHIFFKKKSYGGSAVEMRESFLFFLDSLRYLPLHAFYAMMKNRSELGLMVGPGGLEVAAGPLQNQAATTYLFTL